MILVGKGRETGRKSRTQSPSKLPHPSTPRHRPSPPTTSLAQTPVSVTAPRETWDTEHTPPPSVTATALSHESTSTLPHRPTSNMSRKGSWSPVPHRTNKDGPAPPRDILSEGDSRRDSGHSTTGASHRPGPTESSTRLSVGIFIGSRLSGRERRGVRARLHTSRVRLNRPNTLTTLAPTTSTTTPAVVEELPRPDTSGHRGAEWGAYPPSERSSGSLVTDDDPTRVRAL